MTTEKGVPHFLTALKAFKTQKELTKFLILKKGLRHFLTTLKVFNTEKGHHHCIKVFNTEKRHHHVLTTLKVFQNSYSGEQSLMKVAYHITFMIKELHLL